MNFLLTIVGMALVDRKGRKFLLILGTSGIIVSLIGVGDSVSQGGKTERGARDAVQARVDSHQETGIAFRPV